MARNEGAFDQSTGHDQDVRVAVMEDEARLGSHWDQGRALDREVDPDQACAVVAPVLERSAERCTKLVRIARQRLRFDEDAPELVGRKGKNVGVHYLLRVRRAPPL